VRHEGPWTRGAGADAEHVLAFEDPDGLNVELVAHAAAEGRAAWGGAPRIPPAHAIHGLHGVTLWVDNTARTERTLADVLGFRFVREDGATWRYAARDGGPGTLVDLKPVDLSGVGAAGAGTVHHVAFAVVDDAAELAVRTRAAAERLHPPPVIDRQYFQSVYFREPGGVLIELATCLPGFSADEPIERLGERLTLRARYESERAAIEAVLPRLQLPVRAASAAAFVAATGPEDVSGDALGLAHRYVPPTAHAEAAGGTTLLLLHGTGHDGDDLVPLARALVPGAGVLSPRRKVFGRGAPRVLRGPVEEVFDETDVEPYAGEPADFVAAAAGAYRLARDGIIAMGVGDGADVAARLLLRRPGVLRGAVLLRPSLRFEPDAVPDLRGTAVFIGAGRKAPIDPAAPAEFLAGLL
jgi:predicted esterase/catechol 2,3-dioxygenase-like lactoylglutathione lyase family enzyme